eukprot:scaffold7122_cov102-Isochrysis_galbana.AAC.2
MWVGRISAAGCMVAARQQASGRAGQGAGHALSCRSHSIYIQAPLFPTPLDPRPPSVPHLFFAFAPRTPCALCRPMPIYRPMHMPMYSRMRNNKSPRRVEGNDGAPTAPPGADRGRHGLGQGPRRTRLYENWRGAAVLVRLELQLQVVLVGIDVESGDLEWPRRLRIANSCGHKAPPLQSQRSGGLRRYGRRWKRAAMQRPTGRVTFVPRGN